MQFIIRSLTLAAAGCLLAVNSQSVPAQGPQLGSLLTSDINPVVPAETISAPTTESVLSIPSDRSDLILGTPNVWCGHVIDLLWTNRMRQNSGIDGFGHAAALPLPQFPDAAVLGDLDLKCVHLVAEGHDRQGPVFQLTVHNNSLRPVCDFHITLVAVLGRIHVHSPSVSLWVPRMEAGATAEYRLQLPVSAMCMPGPDASNGAFQILVAAIDSFDVLMEHDELNNVQILTRAEICPLPVAGIAVDVPPTVDILAGQPGGPNTPSARIAESPSAIPPGSQDSQFLDPSTPSDLTRPAPDQPAPIDMDQLDLDPPDGARHLFRQ